jgi:hypothetical protein
MRRVARRTICRCEACVGAKIKRAQGGGGGTVWVPVAKRDGVIESVHLHAHEYRPEYFLRAALNQASQQHKHARCATCMCGLTCVIMVVPTKLPLSYPFFALGLQPSNTIFAPSSTADCSLQSARCLLQKLRGLMILGLGGVGGRRHEHQGNAAYRTNLCVARIHKRRWSMHLPPSAWPGLCSSRQRRRISS